MADRNSLSRGVCSRSRHYRFNTCHSRTGICAHCTGGIGEVVGISLSRLVRAGNVETMLGGPQGEPQLDHGFNHLHGLELMQGNLLQRTARFLQKSGIEELNQPVEAGPVWCSRQPVSNHFHMVPGHLGDGLDRSKSIPPGLETLPVHKALSLRRLPGSMDAGEYDRRDRSNCLHPRCNRLVLLAVESTNCHDQQRSQPKNGTERTDNTHPTPLLDRRHSTPNFLRGILA